MTAKNQRIDLLGIATAAGASVRGAGMGPEALRVAGLTEALLDLDREVVDHGDLRRPQPALGTSPASWRLPEERRADVLDLAARASDQGLEILKAGNFPIFIGGDHSIAMGTVSAVARHCATHWQAGVRAVDRCPFRFQHAVHLPLGQSAWHAAGAAV